MGNNMTKHKQIEIEPAKKFHPESRLWVVQKTEVVANKAVPVYRNGKAVFALPGGGEWVPE